MEKHLAVFFESEKMFESFVKIAGKENLNIIAGDFVKINSSAAITAVSGRNIENIECDNILIVCGKSMKKLPDTGKSGSVSVILSSSGSVVLTEKQLSDYKFITCGFSSRDTVTLSSVTSDKAVVSIQRAFYCINGDKIEPMEIVIDSDDNGGENMLMVVAALLFSGAWKKRRE